MPTEDDLGSALHQRRPMAVVAEMDAIGQDGCHVLKTVAALDRDLPVLLIVGEDPVLLGAVDAVEELWQLSSVVKPKGWLHAADVDLIDASLGCDLERAASPGTLACRGCVAAEAAIRIVIGDGDRILIIGPVALCQS